MVVASCNTAPHREARGVRQHVAPCVPCDLHPLLPILQVGQSEQEQAAVIGGVEVWTGYRSSPRRRLLVDHLLRPAVETIERLLHGPVMDPVKEGR